LGRENSEGEKEVLRYREEVEKSQNLSNVFKCKEVELNFLQEKEKEEERKTKRFQIFEIIFEINNDILVLIFY